MAEEDLTRENAVVQAARVVRGEAFETPEFRWIRLRKVYFVDERGRERQWESAERTTRKGECDGVAIVALVSGPDQPRERIVLVSQFRPPTSTYALELPAGLVDAGENAAKAALRELKEETGYVGEVTSVSPVVFSDPGMSNANMRYVYVKVDLSLPENAHPKTQQEEFECLETHLVFVDELLHVVNDPEKALGRPLAVDARLYSLAFGLGVSRTRL